MTLKYNSAGPFPKSSSDELASIFGVVAVAKFFSFIFVLIWSFVLGNLGLYPLLTAFGIYVSPTTAWFSVLTLHFLFKAVSGNNYSVNR